METYATQNYSQFGFKKVELGYTIGRHAEVEKGRPLQEE
jgi:hypothetical protein